MTILPIRDTRKSSGSLHGDGPVRGLGANRALLFLVPNIVIVLAGVCLLIFAIILQVTLDRNYDPSETRAEKLRFLPKGEALRPALLGYQALGADLIWLNVVQVLGASKVTEQDYEWLYHALDVLTTLDPQYSYAYDAGGTILAELAHRVDWSNQLLEKGFRANPAAWRLPFVLGFNHFFYLQDHLKAAEYMSQAAKIPGRPYYMDTLAARLYVEGGSPGLALQYLESMLQQTTDLQLRGIYLDRYKEVKIAEDLSNLDKAIARYQQAQKQLPRTLTDLVRAGYLASVPDEPFGGEYRLSSETGEVTSSTHPERLHLYRPYEANGFRKNI